MNRTTELKTQKGKPWPTRQFIDVLNEAVNQGILVRASGGPEFTSVNADRERELRVPAAGGVTPPLPPKISAGANETTEAALDLAQLQDFVEEGATMLTKILAGSSCHESGLVKWLRDEKRADGPQGFIGFAISARMSEALHGAILAVPEEAWEPYGEPQAEEIRECAEVPFVPGEKSEHKETEPLRYVGIRIRRQQGGLFEGGLATRHFAR